MPRPSRRARVALPVAMAGRRLLARAAHRLSDDAVERWLRVLRAERLLMKSAVRVGSRRNPERLEHAVATSILCRLSRGAREPSLWLVSVEDGRARVAAVADEDRARASSVGGPPIVLSTRLAAFTRLVLGELDATGLLSRADSTLRGDVVRANRTARALGLPTARLFARS